ncbi:thioester reductase domain-containing protein [Aetokthonos hydrillicola Thurmond2011]|jgi:thioester reductase-like protein|uniref:Thioester reductase domain-containing protein n=1 Tax=Aetokthonos hydrillicola Thurmond2011 TaxID=2712845 RepID=A0AAP5I9G5_9CYAN|nr:thioester reductase domain-containing protein [Aetokthonos hydrillicola]MBO3461046.1 NAD-dependent epimerase/dehydratase family protein [Aetokthonos hydrillicola CCALA 1050]MBW4586299.1 thioester reductase domain-containing protein [Aetokthonos hydrillicola CCALA 1050]MDR9897427.1 thioester reductase domain-containing protein [Aetokthonos hydrillicola Thurmond2011]
MAIKQSHTAEEIQEWLLSHLAKALNIEPSEIDITASLDSYGLDSAQAMSLVTQTEKMLGFEISPTLLWHYPNIEALSQRLAEESQELKSPGQKNVAVIKTTTLNLAAEAVLESSIRPSSKSFEFTATLDNVFLTGGTGFLGAFIINELLHETNADIYCLVRASHQEEGKQKLKQNLQRYFVWEEEYSPRIIPVLGDLSKPLLGISSEGFEMLAANLDAIYHSAAMLNYVYPYSALKAANVLGTQEVLRMASLYKVKPVHYVSSVAIFESPAYAGKVVKEQDNFDHWEGIFLGYSQTKWVSEKLVKIASDRGLPVTIHRPPLISGHSKTGICNTDDFICLMIKGCLAMGCFPDVEYMMDMSPVDYVSKSIVHLSKQKESIGKAFHLQHPNPVPFKKLIDWMRSFGFPLELIPYDQWQAQLVNIASVENPLYTLRPFLLERWSKEQLTIPDLYLQSRRPIISCQDTLDALTGSSIVCPPIDSQLFMTYSAYLIESGFLNVF